MKKYINWGIFISGCLLLSIFYYNYGESAISTVNGLAVAQSSTQWNNLKDAAQGDNLTSGIAAFNLYVFNGTNFDRVRGDITNGLDVDVTRIQGGTDTPADNFTNPTNAITTWNLNGLWDGTNWDRQRSFATNVDGVAAQAVTTSGIQGSVVYNFAFNGSTYDRVRSGANNADGVATIALGVVSTQGYNFVFNGTTWDRSRSGVITGQTLVDNSSNASNNIVTATTTTVKSTAGYINKIIVNSASNGTTVSLYNVVGASCTGTPGSGFTATLATAAAQANTIYDLNHTFTNGICAVSVGASTNITVIYR